MSGLIFSLLLGAVSFSLLTSLFRGELGFREVAEGRGWHGFVREGGHIVEVFVRREGEHVQFILPDRSIPEEVCRRVVEKLSAKLYALVKGEELPPERVQVVGPSHSFCHYCLKPVALPFRCNRCGGYYCEEHRLPERHNCPGGEVTYIPVLVETSAEVKARKRRKIIVEEVACG